MLTVFSSVRTSAEVAPNDDILVIRHTQQRLSTAFSARGLDGKETVEAVELSHSTSPSTVSALRLECCAFGLGRKYKR